MEKGITNTTQVLRPASEVFDYVAHLENQTKWMATIESIEHISGTPGQVGATYKQIAKAMGKEMTGTAEVLEAEPGVRLRTRTSSGPIIIDVTVSLTEADGATTVALTLDPGTMGALFGPMMKKQGRESLTKLKTLLES